MVHVPAALNHGTVRRGPAIPINFYSLAILYLFSSTASLALPLPLPLEKKAFHGMIFIPVALSLLPEAVGVVHHKTAAITSKRDRTKVCAKFM